MTVAVIGSGAREHALVVRLAAEIGAAHVTAVPGNPGIATLVKTVPGDLTSPDALADVATRLDVDLTIVGPEIPLSLGIADRFAARGLLLFGPTAAAAQLESSKAFAKAFMARHQVPTARFVTCDSAAAALNVVQSGTFGFPVVLKADGLAAGKGVVIAETLADAEQAIVAAMHDHRFGTAGQVLVIEECLRGPEVSFFVISDGVRALPIGTAQDHKRIFDDDRGPNTGGMGAFAPSPLVDEHLHARVMREIVDPVIAGMASEGYPFRGFLYVGLMLTAEGPKVIEFNVRLGDPEAQVILPRIASPLLPVLMAAARGDVSGVHCTLSAEKRVGVVIASRGYPESADSGQPIQGLDVAESINGVTVCHAGTALHHGQLVTAGGRVLTVVAGGPSFEDAITLAYAGVAQIQFDGMQFRRDIGQKAIAEQAAESHAIER